MWNHERKMDKVANLFTIYSHVHDMLLDRSYTEPVSGKHATTLSDFVKEYVKFGTLDKPAMNFTRAKPGGSRLVYVCFTDQMSIGIKILTHLVGGLVTNKLDHCILVYPGTITSSAKKYVEKPNKLKIEIFSEDELTINVTKHELMPRHELLTRKEKAKLLDGNTFTESQLPRITLNDPVAKYYGMRRGDVVRIMRRSDTAGEYMTYRLCN